MRYKALAFCAVSNWKDVISLWHFVFAEVKLNNGLACPTSFSTSKTPVHQPLITASDFNEVSINTDAGDLISCLARPSKTSITSDFPNPTLSHLPQKKIRLQVQEIFFNSVFVFEIPRRTSFLSAPSFLLLWLRFTTVFFQSYCKILEQQITEHCTNMARWHEALLTVLKTRYPAFPHANVYNRLQTMQFVKSSNGA